MVLLFRGNVLLLGSGSFGVGVRLIGQVGGYNEVERGGSFLQGCDFMGEDGGSP